jgi:hypothetical protein
MLTFENGVITELPSSILDLSRAIGLPASDIPDHPVLRQKMLAVLGRTNTDCVVFIGVPGPVALVEWQIADTGRKVFVLAEDDPIAAKVPLVRIGQLLADYEQGSVH